MAFPAHKVEELEGQLEMLDVEQSMTYSLADAIREGSTVTGQAIGSWDDTEGNLCAMSAALLAIKARHLAD